jgi:hypothetical protein
MCGTLTFEGGEFWLRNGTPTTLGKFEVLLKEQIATQVGEIIARLSTKRASL